MTLGYVYLHNTMVFFPQRKRLRVEFTVVCWKRSQCTGGVYLVNMESKLKENRAHEIYLILQRATKELCNGMYVCMYGDFFLK